MAVAENNTIHPTRQWFSQESSSNKYKSILIYSMAVKSLMIKKSPEKNVPMKAQVKEVKENIARLVKEEHKSDAKY